MIAFCKLEAACLCKERDEEDTELQVTFKSDGYFCNCLPGPNIFKYHLMEILEELDEGDEGPCYK